MSTVCNDPTCMYVDAYMCHMNKFDVCPDSDCYNDLLVNSTVLAHMKTCHPQLIRGLPASEVTRPAMSPAEIAAAAKPFPVTPKLALENVESVEKISPRRNVATSKPAVATSSPRDNAIAVSKQVADIVSPRGSAATVPKPGAAIVSPRGAKPLRQSGGRGRGSAIREVAQAPSYEGIVYAQHPHLQPQYGYPQYQHMQYAPGYIPHAMQGGIHPPPGYPVQIPQMSAEQIPTCLDMSTIHESGCKYSMKMKQPIITSEGWIAGLYACGQPKTTKGSQFCDVHTKMMTEKAAARSPQHN